MTILEKKVDAIARSLLANDLTVRNAALADLHYLMNKSDAEDKAKGMSEMIDALLLDLGVPDHVLGFRYLHEAISIVVSNVNAVHPITKVLYPQVGSVFHTTGSRAERAIRHAIEIGWDRCDMDVQAKYFGGKVSPNKGKPTNSEFISRCANVIRNKIS